MEIKNNDATRNRPYGERVIDAPAVLVHLPHYIQMLKEESAWAENNRNAITVFKSDNISIVLTCLKKGESIEDVQTEGYSTLFLAEGKLRSRSGEDEKETVPGDILVFHPRIFYSVYAVADCAFLLTHYNNHADPL